MDESLLARRLALLSPAKRSLLEMKLKQNGIDAPVDLIIRRRSMRGSIPLSFAQQRLWFLRQLDPESAAYNQPTAIRLCGSLDIPALTKALDAIVERHETLRTNFVMSDDGVPTQLINAPRSVGVALVNLSGLPETTRESELQREIEGITRRPFDLSRDLMLRACLVKLSTAEHVLIYVTHHIASDGWSSGILWRELATFYGAFPRGEGEANPLLELSIQYADYAVWQREWLQGEVLQRQLLYWKEQLSGIPVLDMPTDRPRPTVQTYRGAKQYLVLTRTLSDQLQFLSRKHGVTLFMTLLAAFQTLLYRYTGQNEIAVGSPIAGRTRAETEGVIGFFVNMLVLRVDVSGNSSFRELLRGVRQMALDAYEHQDIPFEKLVEELHPERDLSRSPLFQVMFAFQNASGQTRELPGLTVSPVEITNETAKFDLSLYMWDRKGGLEARLEYNTDLFDAARVSRMLGHFETLLQGIVTNPDQRISDLPILTETERHQLLVEWNNTQRDYPKDKCIHELFEAQAERCPHAVAVVFENQQLTYGELNIKANQLASHLRELGVGPQTLVGLCVERSLEMIIGLLAILKAGGAYVPLDPAYPKERLAFMLQDAQVQIVLTQQQLLSELPTDHGVQLLSLDTDWVQVAEQADTNLDNRASPEDLAYVIYTSGSTGKPKGVQISHSAVVNFLSSMQCEPGLAANDILLAVTTLSFDIAGLELYLPLAVGARVVIVSREVASDGIQLIKTLDDSGATIMQATPATWRMLLETGWQGSNHLKILCGGEALSSELAGQLLSRFCSLWNMYGPTETTIWSSIYKVHTVNGPVPIGRPIGNTQIYILDRYQQLVPIGVPGELYIGGDGLAQGYLNRSDLTDERFVPYPFSTYARKRLYKTGDLARWLSDGNIEILGRLDHQVKIRGFRIELGEIEAVLSQHPAVRQSVMTVREDVPGDKQLVGYVVGEREAPPAADELRNFLKRKLPDYMIPAAFVVVDDLPLTPNGKLDRSALPRPDQVGSGLETYKPPRTPAEETVAKIWADVLKVERVGVDDNFFDLGGHSLLATKVISRVRATFHIDLPLRSFFQAPTVAELVAVITENQAQKLDDEALDQMLTELESLPVKQAR